MKKRNIKESAVLYPCVENNARSKPALMNFVFIQSLIQLLLRASGFEEFNTVVHHSDHLRTLITNKQQQQQQDQQQTKTLFKRRQEHPILKCHAHHKNVTPTPITPINYYLSHMNHKLPV